ncbi:Gfo/Idh/MocA family protein [Dactylosporangium sp. CA-092794]|uniref:Gfo/Idh/MocA family protein n=1 Tax=Dactylosporangium sp. CA-092794 TaxID=3239929 RepID=UPI003D8ADCDA
MVRWGILGCADIARRKTLPALAGLPGTAVSAVASRDRGRAERLAGEIGCAAVTGYAALLERADVDAVYLPLPPGLHARWADRALRAGKHVLVEKPLATRRADAERLFDLARSHGRVLMENMTFVHHAQHRAVVGLLADGAIGALHGFDGRFTIPPRPDGDIRLVADLGGGALLDQGVYPVRAALYLLGEGLQHVGSVLRGPSRDTVDLAGRALLLSPAGIPASIEFGMLGPYRAGYALTGARGRIVVPRAFTPPDGHAPVVRLERDGRQEERTLPPDRQFRNAIACFLAAVRGVSALDDYEAASLHQADVVDKILTLARRAPCAR